MRILWVENEMGYLRDIRVALEQEGYAIERAESPLIALEKLRERENDYDLIMMDILMGDEKIGNRPVDPRGWTGWTLFEVIRNDEGITTPVLFLSVINDGDLIRKAEAKSNNAQYLVKPVYIPDLLKKVRQMTCPSPDVRR